MPTPQQPIGSGFSLRSSAQEVLEGVDLSGRLAVVTGGYSGIGLATTRALAGAGARVVVPARRVEPAREALAGIDGVEIDAMDLADPDDVGRFVERFLASGRGVDLLIASAGIMACPETRIGPGWEAQLAVNHLGHFALVCGLWTRRRPPRHGRRAGGAAVDALGRPHRCRPPRLGGTGR